jgi:hypothetical protein
MIPARLNAVDDGPQVIEENAKQTKTITLTIDFVSAVKISSESLIMAQDERWRRA